MGKTKLRMFVETLVFWAWYATLVVAIVIVWDWAARGLR